MDEPTRRAALTTALEFGQRLVELAPQPPYSVGTLERPGDQIAAHLHFSEASHLRDFAVAVGLEVSEADRTALIVDGDCDGLAVYASSRTCEPVVSPAAALAEQLLVHPDVLAADAPYTDVVNVHLQVASSDDWDTWLERYGAKVIGPVNGGGDLAAVGSWSGITVQFIGVGLCTTTATEQDGKDTDSVGESTRPCLDETDAALVTRYRVSDGQEFVHTGEWTEGGDSPLYAEARVDLPTHMQATADQLRDTFGDLTVVETAPAAAGEQ